MRLSRSCFSLYHNFALKSISCKKRPFLYDIGRGHTWDLTLVKGFNRGKKDVKKLYYSKTH